MFFTGRYTLYAVLLLVAVTLAVFLVHAKTKNASAISLQLPAAAEQAPAQQTAVPEPVVVTQEQLMQRRRLTEQREFMQSTPARWKAYQDSLKILDQAKQAEIDEVAKTDPAKAAAMAADYQKLRDQIVKYHEQDRLKPWNPSEVKGTIIDQGSYLQPYSDTP